MRFVKFPIQQSRTVRGFDDDQSDANGSKSNCRKHTVSTRSTWNPSAALLFRAVSSLTRAVDPTDVRSKFDFVLAAYPK